MFIPEGIIVFLIPLLLIIFNHPVVDAGEPGGFSKNQTIHTSVNVPPGNLTIECAAPLDRKPTDYALMFLQYNTTEGFKVCVHSFNTIN
jgi:hypothetical protein